MHKNELEPNAFQSPPPGNMQYIFVSGDGFLEVKTSGSANHNALARMVDDILRHADWKAGGSILVNHSDLNPGRLTVGEIRSIANIVSHKKDGFGQARVAHLVTQDLQFGLVRMWEAFITGNWDASTRCFRSRDEAIAWLKSDEE